MNSVIQDLSLALRVLLKSPGLLTVMVGSLALGIGANTAIFSVVRAVLIDPLPYRDAARLVMVWENDVKDGYPENTPSPGNYADWKARNTVFSGMAALRNGAMNLTGAGEPLRLAGRAVTYDMFRVLGVEPMLGRSFTPDEDQPGAAKVAILSHDLWQARFAGNRDLVGSQIQINGEPRTVVGIMPPGFDFPEKDTQIWTPIALTPEQLKDHGFHTLRVVARLKEDATLEAARADMSVIAAQIDREHPGENPGVGIVINLLRKQLVGRTQTALLFLLLTAGSVLLIASANVANLLLARGIARRKELSVRVALGAGRARLMRQLLTESVLVAVAGTGAGLLVAYWGMKFLAILIPEDVTSARLTLDLPMLWFAIVLGLGSTVIFGLLPSGIAWKMGVAETLNQSSARSGEQRSAARLRGVLVAAQTAFAVVLLFGAGLMMQTFAKLSAVDPGFRGDQVLTVRTTLPPARYQGLERRDAFYSEVLRRVEALPGVTAAGFTSWLPYQNLGGSSSFRIEGQPDPAPGQAPDANIRAISPGYLPAMGMKLLRGRLLNEADHRTNAEPAAVINEAMTRFWRGQDPMNRRYRVCPTDCPWFRVVGIVANVHQMGIDLNPRPEYYISYFAFPRFLVFAAPQDLAIRTQGDPAALTAAVRRAVWAVDSQQPVGQVKVLADYLAEDLAPRRFQSQLLGGFAMVALLLAALGLYGVLSYSVAQRRREIGVRAALGAQARDLLRLVIGQGVRPALIGLGIGLASSYGLATYIAGLLYGVEPRDPLTFLLTTAVLLGTAGIACWLPARRAAQVEPMEALRLD